MARLALLEKTSKEELPADVQILSTPIQLGSQQDSERTKVDTCRAKLVGIQRQAQLKPQTDQHQQRSQQRQRKLKPLEHDMAFFRKFGEPNGDAKREKCMNVASAGRQKERGNMIRTERGVAPAPATTLRATPGRAAKTKLKRDTSRSSPSQNLSEIESDGDCDESVGDSSSVESSDGEWDGSEAGLRSEESSEAEEDFIDVMSVRTFMPSLREQPHLRRQRRGQMNELEVPNKQQARKSEVTNQELDGFASLTLNSSDTLDKSKGDPSATIRFFPKSSSPSKKVPDDSTALATPPPSPSKVKLASPKKLHTMPSAPHRPSMDAFWSQDEITTWTDQYSPQKTLTSPPKHPFLRKLYGSDDENTEPLSSPSKSPIKAAKSPEKAIKAARKAFQAVKHSVAETFLQDLDNRITQGQIQKLAEASGGIQIIWSKTLNSTAGRANWRREAVKTRSSPADDGPTTSTTTTATTATTKMTTTYRHAASIELAEKVIDDEERLLNVLAHEYCHLANFMISNVKDQPHGASFKAWAARVTKAYAHYRSPTDGSPINIHVTTKHSYAISYKYAWRCVNTDACGQLYERHSRSINPASHRCGACKAKLVQIRPVPRGVASGAAASGSANDIGASGESLAPHKSLYQIFVQEHFGAIKRELGPGSPHKEVMRELGVRYRASKAEVEAAKESASRKRSGCREPMAAVDVNDTGGAKSRRGGSSRDDCIEVDAYAAEEEDGPGVDGTVDVDDADVNNVARVLDFLDLRDTMS